MKNLKIEFKWALILTISMIIWMFIERLVGLHDEYIAYQSTSANLLIIVPIIVFYLAFREKRKKIYSGIMTYKQGFITGIMLTLFATILNPLHQLITFQIVSPAFFSNMITYVVNQEIMTKEIAENQFTAQKFLLQGIIGTPIMGLVVTSIVAIFTRKKTTVV